MRLGSCLDSSSRQTPSCRHTFYSNPLSLPPYLLLSSCYLHPSSHSSYSGLLLMPILPLTGLKIRQSRSGRSCNSATPACFVVVTSTTPAAHGLALSKSQPSITTIDRGREGGRDVRAHLLSILPCYTLFCNYPCHFTQTTATCHSHLTFSPPTPLLHVMQSPSSTTNGGGPLQSILASLSRPPASPSSTGTPTLPSGCRSFQRDTLAGCNPVRLIRNRDE